jgi:ABC-2 type transport system ATP-binding protein
VEALRGLNLEISEGATYALVGTNGAGKTTLLRILMNILEPTSGRAEVLGVDSRRIAGREFARIGYASENQDMPEWMRVGSFLEYLRPFYPTWDRELEGRLIRQLDLPLDRKIRALSRGVRMKVALASSLAYRPKVIVLDEPFSGLDPLVRDELIESLRACAQEATILISSHDLAEVESFASHVGYLESGTLQFSEKLTTLDLRFRAVEVTLDAAAEMRAAHPASWMNVEASGSAVRFVTSDFDDERTRAEIQHALGDTTEISFGHMSLRTIFTAMAKEGRRTRGGS